MKTAVVGAGGLGGFFGARLAQAGADVTFVARGAKLEALRAHGVTVKSKVLGDVCVPVRASDRPDEIGPVDLVLFCVKTYDLDTAASQMLPLVGPGTTVLPVQNGVDAADQIGRVVGRERVLGGVSWVTASVESPGVILHQQGTRLILGELSGEESSRARRLQTLLSDAGITAELHPDIRVAIWEKFVGVCSANGVLALARLPMGPVHDCPDTWALLRGVIDETVAVARAIGIPLAPDYADKLDRLLSGYAPHVRTSMLLDLLAGRRLELDAINGAVVRLGKEHGVPTPLNFAVYAALKPYANGARPPGTDLTPQA